MAKKQTEKTNEENQIEQDFESLQKQLAESQKQVEEMKSHYLRALADYKNLENRTRIEREQMRDTIKKQIIEQFFPVLDNLDQAEVFTTDPGLQMISKSFRQTLKDLGVEEVELVDTEYDPHAAEVVEVVDGEQDNIIVEVLQKAYTLNGTVIRPGRVKVSKVKS
ncbi:MAG TPA: nucleotide exchange factor GrpE [Candidatus Woesebacteria bacterium]|nr:nucleotide exchange factor GrpE [Candidatus Woesebacteria bacterium]